MSLSRLLLRVVIYGLLVTTFYLGLPAFHYATALMIYLIARHKDDPGALFAPVESVDLGGPSLRRRR